MTRRVQPSELDTVASVTSRRFVLAHGTEEGMRAVPDWDKVINSLRLRQAVLSTPADVR